jgi:hypothetical protein
LPKGKPVAEGGASLMHKLCGAWKVINLSVLPEDPDNPMGPDDPTPKFVKAVQKAFPGYLPTFSRREPVQSEVLMTSTLGRG